MHNKPVSQLQCADMQAIAQHGGDKMQTVSRFFVRVDVVLAAYLAPSNDPLEDSRVKGNADQDYFFLPMISEVSHKLPCHS
jgi:hypothetical protein